MAYSAGFTPHPKVSYQGAAPTGVASEAEYLEIGLAREMDIETVRIHLNAALPDGLDLLEAVPADSTPLADRINASGWRIELPRVTSTDLQHAVSTFLKAENVPVERLTKSGRRVVNTRLPVELAVTAGASTVNDPTPCAILGLVVRHTTPVVRPDDVLTGLQLVADLTYPVPPQATRIVQGMLSFPESNPGSAVDLEGFDAVDALIGEWIIDPFIADRS